MNTRQLVSLVIIAVAVGLGACAFLAWNVIRLVGHRRSAAMDPSVAAVSTAAWLLSVVACFAGPLAPPVALVALVLGSVQWARSLRPGLTDAHRIPARMAVANSAALLAACAAFSVWVLTYARQPR